MRRLILLGLIAAMALPAWAAKQLTVAQLEQALTAATAAHKQAGEIVRLLAGVELTERLSDSTADRINRELNAGPDVGLALALLADRSAFLNLPASELPSTPAPDEATQLRMFDAAGKYVAEMLPHLPNFLATRTTIRYDDSPQELKKGAWPVRAGIHLVDRSSREISVFGERGDPNSAKGSAVWQQRNGLVSWGEFGSVLAMILSDAVNGKVSWSHWENTAMGHSAVFDYSVPKLVSHFEVVSSERRESSVEGFATPRSGSRVSSIGARPNNDSSSVATMHASRGYHGSVWLDPATGTILRITIQADSKGSSEFQRADILVEYGAVEIGGSSFICPVRSLAFSKTQISAEASTGDAASEWLNETLFTGYHRFASTTRIVTDTTPPQ
jgi:hypothetical protein